MSASREGGAWFGEEHRAGLLDFWRVYDGNYAQILAETLRAARAHAEFGPIVAAMSDEQLAQQNRDGRERLRRALDGAWKEYEAQLRTQGSLYAELGISFAGWYDLVGAFKKDMVPLLIREYGHDPDRLAKSLRAMQTFVDHTMSVIAEQYLATKEAKISEQRARAERNEQRYRMLFDNSPAPMWVYDRETLAFLAVNRSAIDHYGYSESEFLGMTIEDIRFPEDLARLRAEGARVKDDHVATDIGEWRHRRKDGTPINVELRLQHFAFGDHKAHMIVATDVTARKRASQALADSEERYRTLVSATSAVVWTADATGGFAPAQRSWQAYTGQQESAYVGLGWADAFHPQDRERILTAWREACAQRALFEAEGRLWNAPAAAHHYVSLRAVPLIDEDGSIREWVGTVADVDERKKAEQPGRFFTLSLDFLCIAGVDGYFKRLNPAFKVLGYSEEELLSRPFLDFVHEDDRAATVAQVERLSHGEPAVAFENRYRCKDGSYRTLMWSAAPDPSGFIYAAARDITDRKRTEEERAALNRLLTERNAELMRVSRAKTDFLAMMSHELRTPLNSIIGFSEVLIDGKFGALNDKQTRYLNNVLQSGRHLLGLINDLLDLSKIEAGRLEMMLQPCAPRALAADAVVTLQPLATARRIKVTLDAGDGGATLSVLADGVRLKQVLYNLLSNAIKFTRADGAVRVLCAASPEPGLVRLSVVDEGPGISPADMAKLFTPFNQLANAADLGGTGLGLALTKQLVEAMGGKIGVHSELGRGSTFFVDLPRSERPTETTSVAAASPPSAPLALVVDDEPAARELLLLALQENGFRTMAVASGDAAIAAARRHAPDVITLDVFLPTIDGWDVLRLLKSNPQTASIPVVMVSISSERARAFSLGAVEHLVKPVGREQLLEALARRSFVSKAKTKPIHVLAIDDDVQQLDLFRAALEPHGFRVRTESSGKSGIAAAAAGPVDLVLLDLVMPDVSGVEVVASLRTTPQTRGVPILLVTAHELSAADRARLNGDVDAIVSKGAMTVNELLGEIRRVLRQEGR